MHEIRDLVNSLRKGLIQFANGFFSKIKCVKCLIISWFSFFSTCAQQCYRNSAIRLPDFPYVVIMSTAAVWDVHDNGELLVM